MSDLHIKEKIESLRKEVAEHNYRYYVLAEPVISDYQFDMKLKELESLEAQYPGFADPNSPTRKVGGAINKEFATVKHQRPMLSLGNTYSETEIRDFDNRVRKLLGHSHFEYACELKIDGLAISLLYENGKLTKAITRGDGVQGDDVTDNVKTIKSLATELHGDFPEKFEIRGEIFMHRKGFERLNQQRLEAGEEPYANPRNVASGSLKMQDSAEVAKRPLDIYLYHLLENSGKYTKHYESLLEAAKWGLKISEYSAKCSGIEQVLHYINKWDNDRKKLSFDIDGVVLKVNEYEYQEELGFTAKVPRWAISYKYKTEAALTKLIKIDYQVGRTGAITPVANLEPVFLLGTTVKRASLHNANEIERLDVREGDWVYVEKGGEIIPKITAVEWSKRSSDLKPHSYIQTCPECHTPLVREEGEAQHYCPNDAACPPQVTGRIQHFIGRKAMNIDGMGDETVEQLFKEGLIHNYADLYTLQYNDLIKLDRMADKSVTNLLEGIEKSKNMPFAKVLFALGIRHVGETVARKLAAAFGSMAAIQNAGNEALCAVDEIGEKIAFSIRHFFSNPINVDAVQRLSAYGLQMESIQEEKTHLSELLKGKTIVISGTFVTMGREELKALIEQHGGKNAGSISSKTDYLVAGENMGPAKLEKAQELGVKIVSEEEFLSIINTI